MSMRTFIQLDDQNVVIARITSSSELTPAPPLFEVTEEVGLDVMVGMQASPELQLMAQSAALNKAS